MSAPPRYDFAVTGNQRRLTENAVILTGAPRSGTTLLGKIVGTLGGLDYHFEPSSIHMITSLAASGRLAPEIAADLLRVYLCEDLLSESVQGRRANLRPTDDSMILNTLSWPGLVERWTGVRSRTHAMRLIAERNIRVAFKNPSQTGAIRFLLGALPRSQILVTVRDGRDVAGSILKRGWTTDASLREELWPYRVVGGATVPFWVEDSAAARWTGWNPETRACYMWRRLAELALELKDSGTAPADRVLFVRYEDLVARPQETIDGVAAFLGCPRTALTDARAREIRTPAAGAAKPAADFLSRVEGAELDLFRAVNARWGYPA